MKSIIPLITLTLFFCFTSTNLKSQELNKNQMKINQLEKEIRTAVENENFKLADELNKEKKLRIEKEQAINDEDYLKAQKIQEKIIELTQNRKPALSPKTNTTENLKNEDIETVDGNEIKNKETENKPTNDTNRIDFQDTQKETSAKKVTPHQNTTKQRPNASFISLGVGVIAPSGVFGDPASASNNIFQSFNGTSGFGGAIGFKFNTHVNISMSPSPKKSEFGINLNFDLNYYRWNWNNAKKASAKDDSKFDPITIFSTGIGPTYTLSTKTGHFDFYYSLLFSSAFGSRSTLDLQEYRTFVIITNGKFRLGHKFGVQLRLEKVAIGYSFTTFNYNGLVEVESRRESLGASLKKEQFFANLPIRSNNVYISIPF